MIRYLLFKFFNVFVSFIPAPVARYCLRPFYLKSALAARAGYQVYPNVFYNPFPDPTAMDMEKLKQKRSLPGINFDMPSVFQLLKELSAYSGEVNSFVDTRTGDLDKWNSTYPPCDAGTQYAMLRKLKPKRYIEVGCGWSTKSSIAALNKNKAEGFSCKSIFIEPFPAPHFLEQTLPGKYLKQKIETVPLALFQELEAGDVLFIDTSHVIKSQNDVEFEFLQVLPSLKPGVVVHVHDIFTPYDYPAEWLVGDGVNRGGNNEQYALECLLSGGRDWQVILPVHLLWRDHVAEMKSLVYSAHRAGAIWLRKR
jgi:hypothetical protein